MSASERPGITGTTRIFGVIADPIEHVRAPTVFNAAAEEAGADAVLVPFHIRPDDLDATLHALARMPNCGGVCVTIPHKIAAAGICDELGAAARATGAVNAILFEDGRLAGDNFDGLGFVAGLEGEGIPPKGRSVLMIGAGGAARAIAFALAGAGVGRLAIANRTLSKCAGIADIVEQHSPGTPVEAIGMDDVDEAVRQADIVVNTTSLGLHEGDGLPCGLKGAGQDTVVADIIMSPEVTAWMKEAESLGLRTHPGRHMLDYQREPIGRFIGMFAAGGAARAESEEPA